MSALPASSVTTKAGWIWLVDLDRYDRSPDLGPAEVEAFGELVHHFSRCYHGHWAETASDALWRFMPPVADTLELMEARRQIHAPFAKVLVREMHARGRSFWGWTAEEWLAILCPNTAEFGTRHGTDNARAYLIAAAYLWGGIGSLEHIRALGPAERQSFARKVFGREVVDGALGVVLGTAKGWGYGHIASGSQLGSATCEAMLLNRSPRLEDLTADFTDELLRRTSSKHRRAEFLLLSRVLHGLGITPAATGATRHRRSSRSATTPPTTLLPSGSGGAAGGGTRPPSGRRPGRATTCCSSRLATGSPGTTLISPVLSSGPVRSPPSTSRPCAG